MNPVRTQTAQKYHSTAEAYTVYQMSVNIRRLSGF